MENQENKATQKSSLKKFLKIFLACFVFLIICIIPISIAKYISRSSNSDSASVAKFNVSVSSLTNKNLSIDLNNGQTATTYGFQVKNNSEVKIEYDIVITFKESLPAGIVMTLDGTTRTSVSNSNKTFTFAKKTLNVGESKDHSLLFTITESDYADYVVSSGNVSKVLSSITIKANARQAQ